jgi:hypothetical protein
MIRRVLEEGWCVTSVAASFADDPDQKPGSITVQLGAMGVPETLRVKTFGDGANIMTAFDRPFHLHVRRVRG